jgi:hypothetical protein
MATSPKSIFPQYHYVQVSKTSFSCDTHHLQKNGKTWWMKVPFLDKETQERQEVRFSLKTPDVEKAKELRDKMLASLEEQFEVVQYVHGKLVKGTLVDPTKTTPVTYF